MKKILTIIVSLLFLILAGCEVAEPEPELIFKEVTFLFWTKNPNAGNGWIRVYVDDKEVGKITEYITDNSIPNCSNPDGTLVYKKLIGFKIDSNGNLSAPRLSIYGFGKDGEKVYVSDIYSYLKSSIESTCQVFELD
jgi:hypothetical protein